MHYLALEKATRRSLAREQKWPQEGRNTFAESSHFVLLSRGDRDNESRHRVDETDNQSREAKALTPKARRMGLCSDERHLQPRSLLLCFLLVLIFLGISALFVFVLVIGAFVVRARVSSDLSSRCMVESVFRAAPLVRFVMGNCEMSPLLRIIVTAAPLVRIKVKFLVWKFFGETNEEEVVIKHAYVTVVPQRTYLANDSGFIDHLGDGMEPEDVEDLKGAQQYLEDSVENVGIGDVRDVIPPSQRPMEMVK